MIAHGDEIGRTQRGNNNAYCQDNELAWIDWQNLDTELLDFTRFLITLRKEHPIFRRRRFFDGKRVQSWQKVPDISWLKPNGESMTPDDWQVGYAKTLTVVLNGSALDEKDRIGRALEDSSFAIMFNASEADELCVVPEGNSVARWVQELDTAVWPRAAAAPREYTTGDTRMVTSRSVVVLRALALAG